MLINRFVKVFNESVRGRRREFSQNADTWSWINYSGTAHRGAKFESPEAKEFAPFISDTMPQLRLEAACAPSMFGSIYVCKQMFLRDEV